MTAANLHRIQRLNMGIGGALIIVAALLRPRSEALGVAVGVALTCLNFFLLTRIITKWTADVAAGRPSPTSLLMVPKMTGLMVLVVLALWLLPISAPAFAVGFSVFVVSIIVEAVYSTVAAPATADAANPTPPSAPSA